MSMQHLNWKHIDKILEQALAEDIGRGDVTSLAMQVDFSAEAKIVSKQDGILAGIEVAKHIFELDDPSLKVQCKKQDGDELHKGDIVLSVSGKGQSILSAERTALNILGRMSGIATLAYRYVEQIKGSGCAILDTRKTMPNLRILDKYAVTCGGAENHRYGLYDMILIKENHIRWAGGIQKALKAAIDYAGSRNLKIEVEVTDLEEYQIALTYPINMIMLDHFSLGDLRKAVALNNSDIILEASGNVSLKTVRDIALTGINVISVGALTHSVSCFDFSLLFNEF